MSRKCGDIRSLADCIYWNNICLQWQIIIVGRNTVLCSFRMFHCDVTSKNHNGPFFTYVQFSTSTASAESCFNHLSFALLMSIPDTPLWSLPFDSSIRFLTITLSYPFCVFSSITIFASILFSKRLCLCAIYFRLLPPQAPSLSNLLSSHSPLSHFIVRQLPSVLHAGDEEGFTLFVTKVFTLGASYTTTYQSNHYFCVSSLS